MGVVEQGGGGPVAILNRNQPVFYTVPADVFEVIMERLEDLELTTIIRQRENEEVIDVDIEDL